MCIAAVLLTACSNDSEEAKGVHASFVVKASSPCFIEERYAPVQTRMWSPP